MRRRWGRASPRHHPVGRAAQHHVAVSVPADELRAEPRPSVARVDDAIEDIHDSINTGVYRAGFADSQADSEDAVHELFDALERWDDHLATQRYAVDDRLTLADVFLFPTLYRFDAGYHTHFTCNVRRLADFEPLWPYARRFFHRPEVGPTCNVDPVTQHYYRSHDDSNPTGIVPVGPTADWDAPVGEPR